MGFVGAGVAEARFADFGTGTEDGDAGGGDEEVFEWVGGEGRGAGYEERGGAVQYAGDGEGGG